MIFRTPAVFLFNFECKSNEPFLTNLHPHPLFQSFLCNLHSVIIYSVFIHQNCFESIVVPPSSGTLFGCGGQSGVPAAASGGDGEAALV